MQQLQQQVAQSGFFGFLTGPLANNIPLPGFKVISLNGQVTATGQVNLYTVPPGKKAMFYGASAFNISGVNGGPFNWGWQLTEGFFLQLLAPTATINNNVTNTFAALFTEFVAQAGDILVSNFNQQPYNLRGFVLEFDDSAAIFSARYDLSAIVAADVNLFTCPQGKRTILGMLNNSNLFASPNALRIFNVGGGAKTVLLYVIPPGKVKDTTTQINTSLSVGVNTNFTTVLSLPVALNPGDQFLMNLSSGAGGVFAYVTGVMYPI